MQQKRSLLSLLLPICFGTCRYSRDKIETQVNFDTELDLRSYVHQYVQQAQRQEQQEAGSGGSSDSQQQKCEGEIIKERVRA